MAENRYGTDPQVQHPPGTDPQYEETTAPQNPPNSIVRPSARTGWLASSFGTLLIVFVIVAAVFTWVFVRRELGKDANVAPGPQIIGTSGEGKATTPGGFNPAPEPNSTREELKSRGAEDPKQASPSELGAKELGEKKK
jgi:hypothetical protein